MKHLLSILTLTLFLSGAAFASFPVKKEKSKTEVTSIEQTAKMDKKTAKAEAKATKQVEKIQKVMEKAAAKGDDPTVAIILALVSVIFFPFALHNWYLGKYKKALWQSLMVFPGFILLLIPLVISWIWQIVDLFMLLIEGV